MLQSLTATSQVIVFSENMGTTPVATNTAVTSYTAFQNGTPVTHSGTAQVSASTPSTSAYTGASGGNNIFFTSNTSPSYSISNINILGATNLRLHFGVFKNLQAQNGSNLLINIIVDGSSYSFSLSALPTGVGTQGWYVQDIPINITGSVLNVTFTSNATGANNWFRVDDVSLISNTSVSLPVVFGAIKATKKNELLSVVWHTEHEVNNDHFEIEASVNGINFKPIQTVATQNGNSDVLQTYRTEVNIKEVASLLSLPLLLGFLGLGFCRRSKKAVLIFSCSVVMAAAISCNKNIGDLKSDHADQLFIRIKQVDVDGTYHYSRILQVVNK